MIKKENPFSIIKILVLMQLGDKIDITVFTNRKKLFLSVFFRVIILVAITVLIYYLMVFLQNIFQININSNLLIFVLMLMQIMGIAACTIGLLKTLYQSKDNSLLLSYPAKHNEVFISKLIVYYFIEFLRNLTFLLPFLLAFGLFFSGIHWTYYLNIVLFTAILPLITVFISALLSLPVMFISDFLKGRPLISGLLLLGFIGFVFYLIIGFLESLPANIELIAYYKAALTKFYSFLEIVGKYGLYLITIKRILSVTPETITSEFLINYSVLLAIIFGLIVLVFLLTMPFYFKIASHAIEMAGITKKSKMTSPKSTFFTFLFKETKLSLRNTEVLLGNFIYLLLMPFLLFIINKIFSLQNTNIIGNRIILLINVCLSLTMVMVSNTSSATAISSEGNEFYLLKTAPCKTRQIAWAKVLVNIVISTISIIISTACIAMMSKLDKKTIFMVFCTIMAINISHVLWSFEFDLLNPQVKEYIATGTTQNNMNANNSMALGVGLAFVFTALLGLLIFSEVGQVAWTKFLIIVFAFLLCRIYLFISKLSVYFDDIEM